MNIIFNNNQYTKTSINLNQKIKEVTDNENKKLTNNKSLKNLETCSVIYDKSKNEDLDINKTSNKFLDVCKIKEEKEILALKNLISKLFSKQGEIWNGIFDSNLCNKLKKVDFDSNLCNKLKQIDITSKTTHKTKEFIKQNNYNETKQTIQKIIEIAQKISQNDPDKIEKLQKTFEKNFKEIKKTYNDTNNKILSIFDERYNLVINEFDKLKDSLKC